MAMPIRRTIIAALLAAAGLAPAAPPHRHGVARLDIAVEAGAVTIHVESPLDNLLGFERAPRSEAERRAVEALLARLRDSAGLFRFDAAARCTPTTVELQSAALQLGPAPAAAAEGHADLDAEFGFRCARTPALLEHGLFDAFVRLQRLELQVATGQRQAGAVLQRPARRIELGR